MPRYNSWQRENVCAALVAAGFEWVDCDDDGCGGVVVEYKRGAHVARVYDTGHYSVDNGPAHYDVEDVALIK